MDDRIHRVLDGIEPATALTPDEADDLAHFQAAIGAALHAVPQDRAPDLTASILARIEDPRPAPFFERPAAATDPARPASSSRAWLIEWLWRPRRIAFTWRPAYVCAAALLAAFASPALRAVADGFGRHDAIAVAATSSPSPVLVQFRLDAPHAREVALAGDFTGWQPAYLLRRTSPGVWTVVAPLDPGIHDYAFIIDGEHWMPDPVAPAVDDGFGGLNSRVTVMTADARRSL